MTFEPNATYYAPQPAPKKPNKNKKVAIILGLLVLAILVACAGVVSSSSNSHKSAPGTAVQVAPVQESTSQPGAVTTPAATQKHALSASDLRLTVKTLSKDCYGSAGCNVEYKIVASLSKDAKFQECDVTYEVRGLEDPQTGTLNLHTDGTYEQSGYQGGSTSNSSRKLTVKVTDVDCSVVR